MRLGGGGIGRCGHRRRDRRDLSLGTRSDERIGAPPARAYGRAIRGSERAARRARPRRRQHALPRPVGRVCAARAGRRPLPGVSPPRGRTRCRRARWPMPATPRCASSRSRRCARLETRLEAESAELTRLLIPKDPRDESNIFLEVRAGTGGDEAAIFAGDLFRMYSRYAERQGWRVEVLEREPGRARRLQRDHQPRRRPGRVFAAQVRVRYAPRAARAGDRIAGTHPHLGLHGRDPARARGDRRGGVQSRGAARRHLSRIGRRRAARQQDRLGDPDHAPADRHRRRVPGRALAAQEPLARDVAAARAAARVASSSARRRSRRRSDGCRSAAATDPSASARTTTRRRASPITAST